MMSKVLVAFAMKEEFAPWRRKHSFRPAEQTYPPLHVTSIGSSEIFVGLTGAGAPEAGLLNDLTAQVNPNLAIVTGVAAGLKPEWRTGDLFVAQTVSGHDAGTVLSAPPDLVDLAVRCGAKPGASLITIPRIARTEEEKTRWSRLGDAADMESLPMISRWSARGIPALAVRVILDPVEMPMTCDFEAAMDSHGQVQISRILLQLARHPRLLPDFLHLARQSRRALQILANFWDRFFGRVDATMK